MKIIISPAKKMNRNTDIFVAKTLPVFLDETQILLEYIQQLSYEEAKAVWKCNDALAKLNYERFSKMNLKSGMTPAILAYEGLQYQHMAAEVFSEKEYEYLEQHLRILSGFYGILSPFDGVEPYRLEMQAKLAGEGFQNLYEFWGDKLYRELTKEDSVIVNLASKEYSKAVEKYKTPQDMWITVEFAEQIGDNFKQKGTLAKMARGEMVRFLAKEQIQHVEQMRAFSELGFVFCEEYSKPDYYLFVKKSLL